MMFSQPFPTTSNRDKPTVIAARRTLGGHHAALTYRKVFQAAEPPSPRLSPALAAEEDKGPKGIQVWKEKGR